MLHKPSVWHWVGISRAQEYTFPLTKNAPGYKHFLKKKNAEELTKEQNLAHVHTDTILTWNDSQGEKDGKLQNVFKIKQTNKSSFLQNNRTYSSFSSLCPPELSVEHSETRTKSQLHPLEKKEEWDMSKLEAVIITQTIPQLAWLHIPGFPPCPQAMPPHSLDILLYLIIKCWHSSRSNS